jgi:hypothetical protein
MGRHEVGFVENTVKTPISNGDGCLFEARFKINKVRSNLNGNELEINRNFKAVAQSLFLKQLRKMKSSVKVKSCKIIKKAIMIWNDRKNRLISLSSCVLKRSLSSLILSFFRHLTIYLYYPGSWELSCFNSQRR